MPFIKTETRDIYEESSALSLKKMVECTYCFYHKPLKCLLFCSFVRDLALSVNSVEMRETLFSHSSYRKLLFVKVCKKESFSFNLPYQTVYIYLFFLLLLYQYMIDWLNCVLHHICNISASTSLWIMVIQMSLHDTQKIVSLVF